MAVDAELRREDVMLVELNPTRGREIRKTRPCLIVSPDDLNAHIRACIVAPLTTGGHPYPFRVACRFQGKSGHVVVDQIRTIDRERLVKRLGRISPPALSAALGSVGPRRDLWQAIAHPSPPTKEKLMSSTLETLQAEVLRLPPADRARLLDRLVASLDTDTEAEAAWDAVADKREQELEAGNAQPVPLDVAIARLEARFPK